MIKCSRAGCLAEASLNLEWRNPKIHSEDKIKVWSSCADHREFLVDYLQTRGFLLQVKEI